MSAPEGKPLQTVSVCTIINNSRRENIGGCGGGRRREKKKPCFDLGVRAAQKVPSNVCPTRRRLLARGQQQVGWSVTADSALIVWNN